MLKQCSILLITCVLIVYSQKLFPGHCPPMTPMEDFDEDRFMGVWYQQATIKLFLKDEATCTELLFKPMATRGFEVETRKVGKLINGAASVYGVAKPKPFLKTRAGTYSFVQYGDLVNEVSTYYILSTDYSGIAVVWSCDMFYYLWNMQNVQVLTRSRTMNTTSLLVSTLKALLPKNLDILLDFISPVDQTQCEEILSV